MKKSVGFVFVALFAVALFAVFVSAAEFSGASSSGPIGTFFSNILDRWVSGDPGDVDSTVAKFFLLVLITFLIYAILSTADFPEKAAIRFVLSFVFAFIATFYITPAEVIAVFYSYTAAGIALVMFVPIAIGVFLTFTLAAKGRIGASYFVKFYWLFLALILLYKAGVVAVTKAGIPNWNTIEWVSKTGSEGHIIWDTASGVLPTPEVWAAFFIKPMSHTTIYHALNDPLSGGAALVLLVVAICMLWFGFWRYDGLTAKIRENVYETEVEAYKAKLAKASGVADALASQAEGGGK